MSYQYAIVGLGVAALGHSAPRSILELETEAARLAIEDAGIERRQVGAALQMLADVGGAVRSRHDDCYARVLGLPVNIYMENIGRGGEYLAMSLVVATRLIDLGVAEYVVVAGARDDWTRSQLRKSEGLRGTAGLFTEKQGVWGHLDGAVTAASYHALLATRHMALYGTRSEDFGAVAVAQRAWANLNPDATMYANPLTLEAHQDSPVLVDPYHLYDFALQSNGGVAFVVTTADRAADCENPVYIAGIGFGEHLADLWWTQRNYDTFAVEPARSAAFRQAGIQLEDLSFAQLYDCFPAEVIIQLEDYGWCGKGEGGGYVAAGNTTPDGLLPVNTGGGLLSAYHLGNLTGLIEAIYQIRGTAGDRQVSNAQLGLVTGHGGEIVSGSMCSIHTTTVLAKGRR